MWNKILTPFSVLTLLFGRQERHPACRLGVDMFLMTICLELSTSYSSSCQLVTTTSVMLAAITSRMETWKHSGTGLASLS